MVKVNEKLELQIESLGVNGEGVARFNGLTIFVQGALPHEKVLACVNLVKKNYAVANLEKIINPSPERVMPPCPIYDKCGGCQLQHFVYQAQLEMKRQKVKDALLHLGHLECNVLPVLGMQKPYYYRNKMQFPVGNFDNKLAIGCYAVKTHQVTDTKSCLIQSEDNNVILQACRKWMEFYHIAPYDEKNQSGIVRHIMGRTSQNGVMVVIVTKNEKLPNTNELIKILQDNIANLQGVVQNINTKVTNIIMGGKSKVLWGKGYIKEKINSLEFDISAESFFQVNTQQAEVLYNEVLVCAGLSGQEIAIDVYCGTGTISLILAQQAKKVFGIEIVPQAICNANANAEKNKIKNVEFICGDAAKELPKLLQQGVVPDVITLDPPRAGCEEKVLNAIMSVQPKKIIYVSCNPATLARDLFLLTKNYIIEKVQPVDMFPQTTHIETVVKLKKKDLA